MIALNFQTLFELDTNPGGTASYARLGKGLTTPSVGNNEAIDGTAYLDGDGGKTSEVTGYQQIWSFAGFYDPADAAQAYIQALEFSPGASRHTNFRITDALGNVKSGDVTIANIAIGGGEANGKSAMAFELHFNGKPTKTNAVAATAPTVTFAAATTLSGGTKAAITAAAGNTLHYKMATAQVSAKGREYVDVNTLSSYADGQEVAATAGQYFTIYELDAYKHIVKFISHLVVSGEIKS